MELKIYTVYDTVAQDAGPLFTAVNTGVATRQYRALLNDIPEAQRSEFKLMEIGSYSSHAPQVIPQEPIEIITSVMEAYS